MNVALAGLPEMCSAYQACIGGIILDLIILNHRIFFDNHFHYLVGKTIGVTNRDICLYHLQLAVLSYMHQAAWLAENIAGNGISDIINVYRVLYCISFFDMDKKTTLHKGRVQRIDPIFQIMMTMPQVLLNEFPVFISRRRFLQGKSNQV